MKRIIQTNNAPQAIGPYVQGVTIANNLVYTSGQIPLTPNGELKTNTIEEQTEQVMLNLKAVLEAANSSMEKVIKTTCFVADMNHFSAFNAIYERHFNGVFPARSCVEVSRLPKDVLIEVEAIAHI